VGPSCYCIFTAADWSSHCITLTAVTHWLSVSEAVSITSTIQLIISRKGLITASDVRYAVMNSLLLQSFARCCDSVFTYCISSQVFVAPLTASSTKLLNWPVQFSCHARCEERTSKVHVGMSNWTELNSTCCEEGNGEIHAEMSNWTAMTCNACRQCDTCRQF